MRDLVVLLLVSGLVMATGCKKLSPNCAALDKCCKATDASGCPTDYAGIEDYVCRDRLDAIKKDLAASKKPAGACSP